MNSLECFRKIKLKLNRTNLSEYKKVHFIEPEEELDIDLFLDGILAWIGKFHKLENDRRFLALEKTVKIGGVDWYEYFKSCEALIDVYNKRESLRSFADKLFIQETNNHETIVENKITVPVIDTIKKKVTDACELFKALLEEEPNKIPGVTYLVLKNN